MEFIINFTSFTIENFYNREYFLVLYFQLLIIKKNRNIFKKKDYCKSTNIFLSIDFQIEILYLNLRKTKMSSYYIIDSKHNIWSCGDNEYGKLGLGDFKKRNKFQKINSKRKFIAIANGSYHFMVLDDNGCIWSCGCNEDGQLGLNNFDDQHKLKPIDNKTNFVLVCSGSFHSVALDESGSIWSCGDNGYYKLGLNKEGIVNTFEKISTNNKFKQISCGSHFTVALDNSGLVWYCGLHMMQSLNETYTKTLTLLNNKKKITQISSGH